MRHLFISFLLFLSSYAGGDGSAYTLGAGSAGWISCTQATPCASSATTFFVTGGATTLYRISASVNCTSATAAATAILTLKYTDPSSTLQTLTVPTATCTTLGALSLSFMLQSIVALNATNIQYSVATVNSPNYQARIAVYQEGVN
jgi:hypothetical protein